MSIEALLIFMAINAFCAIPLFLAIQVFIMWVASRDDNLKPSDQAYVDAQMEKILRGE